MTLNRITNKSNIISGYYNSGGSVFIAIASGEGESFRNSLYSVELNDNNRYQHFLEEKLEMGTKVYVMARFVNGKILLAQSFTVTAGRPNTPTLLRDITNTDKEVKVSAAKDCEITLTIGKKTYTTNEYIYDELSGQYIYTLATDRDVSGTSVTVTSTNESGTSDPLITQLVKVSPDPPTVNTVYEG